MTLYHSASQPFLTHGTLYQLSKILRHTSTTNVSNTLDDFLSYLRLF